MFCKVIGMNHFAEAPTLFADHDDVQRVTPRAPSYLADHRKRLRERFNSGGAAAIPDYELLELVLFRAIPRQDVKPLARALIDTFRDFNGVLSAPAGQLTKIKGCGPTVVTVLKIVSSSFCRCTDVYLCTIALGKCHCE